jgi:hypothetical protein
MKADGIYFLVFLYADPGSGMLIWQLITAAGLGLLFYSRTIVRKIRGLLGNDNKREKDSSPTNE